MYKAIFLDLDGTLLDDDKNVSEENRKAIKNAKDNGVYVCLCSGRQKDAVEEYKNMAGTSRYIISSNGAQIYDCDKKEVLYACSLDKDICNKLVEFVIENNFFIRTETKYSRYINKRDILIKYEIILEDNKELRDLVANNDILQCSIATNSQEDINKTIEFVKKLNRSDIKIENVFKDEIRGKVFYIINIINTSTSKGNAINGLCKYLKIDINDVIAMGDDKNDLSMLEAVGLGVAMGNAEDIVKKVAKEVTKTNIENGVAEIINSKILNNV